MVPSNLTDAEFLRLYRFNYDDEIISRFERLVENYTGYSREDIKTLEYDLERAEQELSYLEDDITDLEHKIENLELELATYKPDAERFEWLVTNKNSPLNFIETPFPGHNGRWDLYLQSESKKHWESDFREDLDNLIRE